METKQKLLELILEEKNLCSENGPYFEGTLDDLKLTPLGEKEISGKDYQGGFFINYATACWGIGREEVAQKVLNIAESLIQDSIRQYHHDLECGDDVKKLVGRIYLNSSQKNLAYLTYLREAFKVEKPIVTLSDETIQQLDHTDLEQLSMLNLYFCFRQSIKTGISPSIAPNFFGGLTPLPEKNIGLDFPHSNAPDYHPLIKDVSTLPLRITDEATSIYTVLGPHGSEPDKKFCEDGATFIRDIMEIYLSRLITSKGLTLRN